MSKKKNRFGTLFGFWAIAYSQFNITMNETESGRKTLGTQNFTIKGMM